MNVTNEHATPQPESPARASRTLAFAAALFACVSGLSLSACNTMEGAGEDIQSAGESIEDAAND